MKLQVILAPFLIFTHTLHASETTENLDKKTSTHELIQLLLAQDLGTRKFAFTDVIHAATGKKIIPLNGKKPTHQLILKAVRNATKEARNELSSPNSPIRKLRRINEASRYFETLILKKLNQHPELQCGIPINNKGNQQSSGYPDMLITHTAADGTTTHAYLDPKLFEEKSRASSLRTFYYEPRTHTNKIQHNALHLLIGISHDGKEGAWQFIGSEVCDLSHFHVRLKAEFQASNRELYRKPVLLPAAE